MVISEKPDLKFTGEENLEEYTEKFNQLLSIVENNASIYSLKLFLPNIVETMVKQIDVIVKKAEEAQLSYWGTTGFYEFVLEAVTEDFTNKVYKGHALVYEIFSKIDSIFQKDNERLSILQEFQTKTGGTPINDGDDDALHRFFVLKPEDKVAIKNLSEQIRQIDSYMRGYSYDKNFFESLGMYTDSLLESQEYEQIHIPFLVQSLAVPFFKDIKEKELAKMLKKRFNVPGINMEKFRMNCAVEAYAEEKKITDPDELRQIRKRFKKETK